MKKSNMETCWVCGVDFFDSSNTGDGFFTGCPDCESQSEKIFPKNRDTFASLNVHKVFRQIPEYIIDIPAGPSGVMRAKLMAGSKRNPDVPLLTTEELDALALKRKEAELVGDESIIEEFEKELNDRFKMEPGDYTNLVRNELLLAARHSHLFVHKTSRYLRKYVGMQAVAVTGDAVKSYARFMQTMSEFYKAHPDFYNKTKEGYLKETGKEPWEVEDDEVGVLNYDPETDENTLLLKETVTELEKSGVRCFIEWEFNFLYPPTADSVDIRDMSTMANLLKDSVQPDGLMISFPITMYEHPDGPDADDKAAAEADFEAVSDLVKKMESGELEPSDFSDAVTSMMTSRGFEKKNTLMMVSRGFGIYDKIVATFDESGKLSGDLEHTDDLDSIRSISTKGSSISKLFSMFDAPEI